MNYEAVNLTIAYFDIKGQMIDYIKNNEKTRPVSYYCAQVVYDFEVINYNGNKTILMDKPMQYYFMVNEFKEGFIDNSHSKGFAIFEEMDEVIQTIIDHFMKTYRGNAQKK